MVDSKSPGDSGCPDSLERETRFGVYSVVLKRAKGLNEALRLGLGLGTDDLYLEVHVPEAVKGRPTFVLESFKSGALELADFLRENGLNPEWLIGITHQNVAGPAQRFLNFRVISGIPDEAVDREKSERIAEGYSKTNRWQDGMPRGPLCLCYQSFSAFLDFTESLRRRQQARRL
jgi:hypothetical protein